MDAEMYRQYREQRNRVSAYQTRREPVPEEELAKLVALWKGLGFKDNAGLDEPSEAPNDDRDRR